MAGRRPRSVSRLSGCGIALAGTDEAEVRAERVNDETQNLIDTFRKLSRRSYASGLAALYAYESQLPTIAKTKIKGLVERYDVDEPRALKSPSAADHRARRRVPRIAGCAAG